MSSPHLPLALCSEAFWMRATARFALAGWMLPAIFSVFAAFQSTPVQAQTPVQTVVVLDFAVAGGIDPLVGRKAADGLAVELQRSGDFEVVPRQRVEEAVAQQAGLQPPFNDTTQKRLGETVNARSVFSGRVLSVNVTPGKSAQVNVEARQLDVATGDYINGTQVIETTEQKLTEVANEILVDEALNKAVFSAVRSMRQTTLPMGTVLNTTRDDIELSIGARNGVSAGQRYSVLRDVYNRARNLTVREKIGEITITRVENDQSTAKLSAGGAAGVRTQDRVRQIFVPGYYPVSTSSTSGGSVSPVTAPPTSRRGDEGGAVKKAGRGALGLLGLAALVGLAGLGGGSNGGTPRVDTGGNGVVYIPSDPANQAFQVANSPTPSLSFSFTAGFRGIGFSQQLQREALVGYIIYRGTTPNFTPQASNIQAFVRGTEISSSSSRVTFTDPSNIDSAPRRRTITISSTDGGDDNNNNTSSGSSGVSITEESEDPTGDGDERIDEEDGEITIEFTQKPLTIGRDYYYRVSRITAERVTTTGDGGNDGGNGGNDGGNNNTETEVNFLPIRSGTSNSSDALSPLFLPRVIAPAEGFNTDNLVVEIGTDLNDLVVNPNYIVPQTANVGTGVDSFIVDVSRSRTFQRDLTISSGLLPNPNPNAGFNQTLQLVVGDIRIPSPSDDPYRPGVTPLFLRVRSIGGSATAPSQRISNTFSIAAAAGADSVQISRFVTSKAGSSASGVRIGGRRNSGTGAAGGAAVTARVGKPR